MIKNGEAIRGAMIGRQIGLGQAPNDQCLDNVCKVGITQQPVVEYTAWTVNVPLKDSEIQATFGQRINLFNNSDITPPGVSVVDSSLIGNATQTDILVHGFGLAAYGEPFAFSVIGNAFPIAAATVPPSFDAFTAQDQTAGAMGTSSASIVPAVLEWGGCDWEALFHMMQAYQFQWWVNNRCLLVNELAADVCSMGPYASGGDSASSSEYPVQQFVKRTNARYREQGASKIFAPANWRRSGSATVGQAGITAVGHFTRDYDLAPLTWGGLSACGVSGGGGCGQSFRKFACPVLIEKGTPWNMFLEAVNDFHQAQFHRLLSITESTGGTDAVIKIDETVNGFTQAGAGIAEELTFDPLVGGAPVFQAQSANTNRQKFKGGTLKIVFSIKGTEIWGNWKPFLCQKVSDGAMNIMMPGMTNGGPGLMPLSMNR